jgi:hypothetical protein
MKNDPAAGRSAEIVLIGDTDGPVFQSLTSRMHSRSDATVVAEFPEIRAALRAGIGADLHADLILVFQRWSDEYVRRDVDELIGRTLFSRVFCSYGPWCVSDGRTRDIWPVAFRVPLAITESCIEMELKRFRQQREVLLPTASSEETFADRCSDDSVDEDSVTDLDESLRHRSPEAAALTRQTVLAVSPDRVLRDLWAQSFQNMGCTAVAFPLLDEVSASRRFRISPSAVIHDLDPDTDVVRESIRRVRQLFPVATLYGAATMPEAWSASDLSELGVNRVVLKLDLIYGIIDAVFRERSTRSRK